MNLITCSVCGGKVVDGKQKYHHARKCPTYLVEGVDHVVCKECGYRSPLLSKHIMLHGMTEKTYHEKYPDAPLVISRIVERRAAAIKAHGGFKPISERRRSGQCQHCGDWFIFGGEERHLQECQVKHPDKYVDGKDYVKCPDCGKAFLHLGRHLRKEHGWDKDKLAKAVNEGLQLSAEIVKNRWSDGQNMAAIQQTREIAMKEKYGVANPFSLPEVQKKIRQTNQGRYGVSHPMQNAEVFSRQQASAQNGPSGQEVFFMEHVTSPSVIYTGYGGRFVRVKTGVMKYGREVKDLNPDFMVFPDNVLESATSASKERRKLDNLKHRTKYVIELLGDWYHSEQVIGVPPAEHERQIVEAYKSAGIECLTLWEHNVMERWNIIQAGVEAWIQKAVADINANPVWKKATKNKVDGRLATFVCPYGSGRKFKTVEQLEAWKADPLNFWRPEMMEGRDYIRCLECSNVRIGKVAEHIRKMHGGMTKGQYLEKHPDALLVAERVSRMVSVKNHSSVTGFLTSSGNT